MCGMKKLAKNPNSSAQVANRPAVPPFTPGPIRESAVRAHFARGEMQRITGNRWFLFAMIEAVIILTQATTFAILLPLKSTQTVILHEYAGGRLSQDQGGSSTYVPDHDAIAFFMSSWLDNVYDINSSTLQQKLALAGKMTVGNATDQLSDLLAKENPYGQLHDDPQLRQTFNRVTVNFVNDDTVFIRYTLTKRPGGGSAPQVQTWAMTITFTRIPPNNETVKWNPAGLYVTSFNVNQES